MTGRDFGWEKQIDELIRATLQASRSNAGSSKTGRSGNRAYKAGGSGAGRGAQVRA